MSPFLSLIRGAGGGAAHCRYEHEGPTLFHPCSVPAGDRLVVVSCVGMVFAMDEVDDADLVVERVAAWDQQGSGRSSGPADFVRPSAPTSSAS